MVVFKILSKTGRVVSLDEERWRHVLEHPEMKNQLDRIKETALTSSGFTAVSFILSN